MGIWEWTAATAEAVKRNAPDTTPVKNACRNTYTCGAAAITKIDETVKNIKGPGQWMPDATPVKDACRNTFTCGGDAFTNIVGNVKGLGQLMPDDETKSKIGIYTTVFAKNAAHYALEEGYKSIPGGVAIGKIVSKTLNDVKYEDLKVEPSEKKASSAADKSPKDKNQSVYAKL